MAVVGQIVPEGVQNKESFHGLRRTTEGLLYYTKVDKTTIPYKDYEYVFNIDYKKKEIRELEKNLINVWDN